MAADIPTVEPEIIRAGESLTWSKTDPDYSPVDGYSLKYYLTGPSSITITATTYNTTGYLVSVTPTLTAAYVYGIYQWERYAEKTGEKWFRGSGFVTIKTAAGKSFAKTMLDAIEAILSGRATSKDLDLVSKNLGGSSLSRDPAELMKNRDKFRAEYSAEVASENREQGKASGNRVLIRFRNPS